MTNEDQKLKDLQDHIDALNEKHNPAPKTGAENESMSVGLRAGTELVAAVGMGALMGYGIDKWLDSKPWGLIIMLVLGIATGFMNVWRTTQNLGHAVGYKNLPENEKKTLANGESLRK